MARYGVRLENDPTLTPRDYQELARQAEDRGYETVWVPEGAGRDSLTTLSVMALNTERVRLGTGILAVFARTPTNTAMGAAGMAAVSGGRFVLGLGVGHQPTVEGRDGIPFRHPMTRLRETIEIVRALLAGEQLTYPGKQFKITNASLGAAASWSGCAHCASSGSLPVDRHGEALDGHAARYACRPGDKPGTTAAEIGVHARRSVCKAFLGEHSRGLLPTRRSGCTKAAGLF